jgi:hypothetical protein
LGIMKSKICVNTHTELRHVWKSYELQNKPIIGIM